jgi:hypothetical protein
MGAFCVRPLDAHSKKITIRLRWPVCLLNGVKKDSDGLINKMM